ncbi:MAG: TIGR04255 family protein [Desulfobulbaceae bacterium]|nr:MAG: TIGR04255 family protein [Desulfobulbaceae bacterium]
MGKKMRNAPVYFTIVQVRFNSILTLESYAPKIQESLRKQNYPDVKKGVINTFNMASSLAEEDSNPHIPLNRSRRYMFSDMERTSGFILDEGALTFQTTNYETFEKFSDDFLNGLKVVHEVVELSYTDRIGIRYLDAVFPKEGENLSEYLAESVQGIAEKLNGNIVHSFSETLARRDDVNLLARAIIQNGKLGFPPDVHSDMLNIKDRFKNLQGLHAILDTDGFTDRREPFSLEKVHTQLYTIHEEIRKAFYATITEKALKTWE